MMGVGVVAEERDSEGRHEVVYSRALLRSLCDAPLLVGDLPEAFCWAEALSCSVSGAVLDFDQKLGHLYEDALEALIRASARFELLAKNLQVFDATGRTLVEMDFLVRDRENGESFQLELAVKFYLSILKDDGTERFPGPDPRDNWSNKLQRMRTKQLRLARSDEAKRLLLERFGLERVAVFQRIYGIIFDHVGAERLSAPPCIRSGCRRARWVYVGELAAWDGLRGELKIVPKCLWPVCLDGEVLASLERVAKEDLPLRTGDRCLLVWDSAIEDVVFVVPDGWPEID